MTASAQRRLLIKRMLFARLGIEDQDTLRSNTQCPGVGPGAGSKSSTPTSAKCRRVAASARGRLAGHHRLSFDEEGHGPADDRAKIEQFLGRGEAARTFVWLPRFSIPRRRLIWGTLVILDYLLTGERFIDHASHLFRQIAQRRGRCLKPEEPA